MTELMRQCLAAIRDLTVNGVPPSYEELRVALGFSSRGQVQRLLDRMQGRGLITFEHGRARSLRVIDPVEVQAEAVRALCERQAPAIPAVEDIKAAILNPTLERAA